MPTPLPTRPRVFLDIQSGSDFLGRIIIEIFSDKTPKTAENFRAICTPSSAQPLTYKGSPFHRIVNEFMIQGGDITAGNGTGGMSIYGPVFEDENIGWREIDAVGLVCMANRGKGTNSSQYFITLAPCQHLNAKHTVFGHVIKGMDVCQRMSEVSVDKRDRPLSEIIISDCGELQSSSRSSDLPPFSSRFQDGNRSQAGATQGTADIVIDLNHPVEGAMLGLMKIAVAARLLDHCLHMTIHLDLHKQNAIVVEDAAPLLRVRVLQNDQDRPT
ncbi:MAG: hypothetical protein Q9205_002460 [Flavoplaca limonia]